MTSAAVSADVYDAPQADLGREIPNEQSGLFGFKGRLSVLGYMARGGIIMLLMVGMVAILYGAFLQFGPENPMLYVVGAVGAVVILASSWVSVALFVKRLHDVNLSAWWMLLTIVPIVGVIFMLVACVRPGKPEPNRFGHAVAASGWEKPMGVIGIVLVFGLTLVSVASDFSRLTGIVLGA